MASSSPSPSPAAAKPPSGPKWSLDLFRVILPLEAMKAFAAVSSPGAGTVTEICVKIGESVESKDLLVRLVK
ncbi:biotin/lipoyl-containing protein [Prosthecobacter sp.]|uniref:biotin/lipoyl-containing protein n=1 Tax=Prosthecobacter sp. TaxID=1965333 RepID=UPI0037833A95